MKQLVDILFPAQLYHPATHRTSSCSCLHTQCCSSFILLRAEPALNQSIWVSLKLWLSSSVSWLPSLCFTTALRGWGQRAERKGRQSRRGFFSWTAEVFSGPTSYLSWRERFQSFDGDLVIRADLVVVGWVAKGEGKQALLLKVCFWGRGKTVKMTIRNGVWQDFNIKCVFMSFTSATLMSHPKHVLVTIDCKS